MGSWLTDMSLGGFGARQSLKSGSTLLIDSTKAARGSAFAPTEVGSPGGSKFLAACGISESQDTARNQTAEVTVDNLIERFNYRFGREATMTVSSASGTLAGNSAWPDLPLKAWQDTYATLHLWTQIVGKIRLACTPWLNHSWHVVLYLTAYGLTTSPIPYGGRTFQIDFDFIGHQLVIRTSDGAAQRLPLRPCTVADFYREIFAALRVLNIEVAIRKKPNEMEHPILFDEDREHAAYDAEHAHRCWRVLAQADRVLKEFRARYIGKCSPVHFFWGSFDLAVTRFSGRPAPEHPGGVPNLPDWVVRDAYSHEVSSGGFWPGNDAVPFPAFYAYAYPEPEGFRDVRVRPESAFYSRELREFILPYDDVRQADSPDRRLLEFLQSTYDAAADLGHWDRSLLERGDLR
jgi:hypothetical protein